MDKDFQPDIQRLSARPYNESVTLLLFGPSGSGKTYFAGTVGPRNVIFNSGVGDTTLKSPAFRRRYPFDPWTIEIPATKQPIGYLCDSVEWLIKNRRDDFDALTFDDFSAIRRYAMIKAIEINADLNKTTTQASAKKHGGIIAPQIADYGEEMSVIEWFINHITSLAKQENFHLICTAHQRISFNKPAKIGDAPTERLIRPGFTGQTFPDQVPAFFDEVWYNTVIGKGDNKKYRTQTQGDAKVTGKSRHGGVFEEIEEDLNFATVLKKIHSHQYITDPNDPNLLIAVK